MHLSDVPAFSLMNLVAMKLPLKTHGKACSMLFQKCWAGGGPRVISIYLGMWRPFWLRLARDSHVYLGESFQGGHGHVYIRMAIKFLIWP